MICREFKCLWRAGIVDGDERRRPDRLKVMFSINELQDQTFVEAWETEEGAFRDHPARGVIDAVNARAQLMLRFYGVPCSMVYRGSQTLALGQRLSRLARENPPELAAWIRTEVRLRGLGDVEGSGLEQTLQEMESRRPVG